MEGKGEGKGREGKGKDGSLIMSTMHEYIMSISEVMCQVWDTVIGVIGQ